MDGLQFIYQAMSPRCLTLFANRLIIATSILIFTATQGAAQIPASTNKTQAPQFSLETRISEDVIRTDKEIPLEVIITPSRSMSVGVMYGPPLWTRFCRLDVHDSSGKELEEKSTMDAFRLQSAGGPQISLVAGEKMRVQMLLNRIYDFSTAGGYTIQASRYDDNGTLIRSNVLTLVIPASANPRTGGHDPRFSVALSSPISEIKVGYQMPVNITVKNISKESITLRTWEEDTRVGAGVSHEFASGIELRDGMGNPAPRTEQGRRIEDDATFPKGGFRFVSLDPGEEFEQTRILGQVYDLGRPGNYQLQVSFFDPLENLRVKSNPLTVKVVQEQSGTSLRPPFLLDIREAENFAVSGRKCKPEIFLAISNLSDHPIDFVVRYGDNVVNVYDAAGNLAPLTDNGKLYRHPRAMGPPLVHLLPGETASGGSIDLASLYDLSRPGRYTVEVIAFDPETNTNVTSNRISLVVGR